MGSKTSHVLVVFGALSVASAGSVRILSLRLEELSERREFGWLPRLGTQVNLPARDVMGDTLNVKGKRTLLLYGGSCSSCTRGTLDFDQISRQPYQEHIVFYSAAPEEVLAFNKPVETKVKLTSDADFKLTNMLNPGFVGRWYVLEGSKLVDMQRRGENEYAAK